MDDDPTPADLTGTDDPEPLPEADVEALRRHGDDVRDAQNRGDAVASFCSALVSLITCDLAAVLDTGTEDHAIHIWVAHAVPRNLIAACEHEMLARHTRLMGADPRRATTVRVHVHHSKQLAEGAGTIRHVLAVPFGDGSGGLLAVMSQAETPFSPRDGIFLDHAARHLAHVLRAIDGLREDSRRDPMTGLFNRKGLAGEFERLRATCAATRQPVAAALVDLDHFKQLNDTHGHLVGDLMLIQLVALVRRVARATDIVARFGGDELAVILPQAGTAEALSFAERLLQTVWSHVFSGASGDGHKLTISIGVAASEAADLPSTQALLGRADTALLEAKRLGRNRVCIHQPARTEPPPQAPAETPVILTPRANGLPRGHVLVVDDEAIVSEVLLAALRRAGFEADAARTAPEAIAAVREHPACYDVVLADLHLPGMSGFELIDAVRALDSSIMNVVITGQSTVENALRALRRGVFDFLEKPLRMQQVSAVVANAVEFRRLRRENARYQSQLEDLVQQKSAALQHALDELRDAHNFTLDAMATMLDAREQGGARHTGRVRDVAIILASHLGLSPAEVDEVSRGALLHDLGNICVPDAILLKSGTLSAEELRVVRAHPEIGYRLLHASPHLHRTARIVLQHQERYDGTGYPAGLKGEAICEGARVFAVADAYDAMRSGRVYRPPRDRRAAVAELTACRGTQFDPRVVDVFLTHLDEIERVGGWDAETES